MPCSTFIFLKLKDNKLFLRFSPKQKKKLYITLAVKPLASRVLKNSLKPSQDLLEACLKKRTQLVQWLTRVPIHIKYIYSP